MKYLIVLAIILGFLSCQKDPDITNYTHEVSKLKSITSEDNIRFVAVFPEFCTYLIENRNVCIYDRALKSKTYLNELNSNSIPQHIVGIEQNQNGDVLIGDSINGIMTYSKTGIISLYWFEKHLRFFDNSCEVCFVSENQIGFRLTNTGSKRIAHDSLYLPESAIKTAIASCYTYTWVGTKSNGVFRYNPYNPTIQFSKESGALADNEVLKIMFIKSSEPIVLTKTALSLLIKGKWSIVPLPEGVVGQNISHYDENIYIATDYGVYQYINGQIESLDAVNSVLPNIHINEVIPDSSGDLWIATQHGLYVYDNAP